MASGSNIHITDENLSRTAANIVDTAVAKHVPQKKKSQHQSASNTGSRKSHAPGPSKKSKVDLSRKSHSRSGVKSRSKSNVQGQGSNSKKSVLKSSSRKSHVQPKTIEEEYQELLELGNCFECEWTKNYHPCLQSGSENNEKCKEAMRKRGFDYKEPIERCREKASKHEHGYQPGHFYALNNKSHIDDEEDGEIVHEEFNVNDPLGAKKSMVKMASSSQMQRSKSLHETESQKRKSRKSQNVSPSKSGILREPDSKTRKSQAASPSPSKSISANTSATYMARKSMLAQSKSVQDHAHYHATKHTRSDDSDEDVRLKGSPSSHTNMRKSRSKAKSQKSSKTREKEVDSSPLEYENKLHPKATAASDLVARDNLVPVPSDMGIKKGESKTKFMNTTPEDFDCSKPSNKNSAICKPQKMCSFNKNYHPCNNTANKEDAELCRLWIKQRGITASERMVGGKLVGLNKTISGTTTTTPSEMVEIDGAVDGAIGGARDNLSNKKKIIIKGQGERDEEGLVLCAPDTPFSEMSEAQVRQLVKDLISTAKKEHQQEED